jgi:hypothetical protein
MKAAIIALEITLLRRISMNSSILSCLAIQFRPALRAHAGNISRQIVLALAAMARFTARFAVEKDGS